MKEVEVGGEDYTRNREKERQSALNEAIDGAVTDCILTVDQMLWDFYNEKHPDWYRKAELRLEARARIKKILK